jgi:hypothetical protein
MGTNRWFLMLILRTPIKIQPVFFAPSSSENSKLVFKLTVVDDKDASGSHDVTLEVEMEIESQSN